MYSKRLVAGFKMASQLHEGHERKGVGTPYLSHLLGVASLVIEHGGDDKHVIAALLHDAVEDCGGKPTLDKIRKRFGKTVAKTVEQCSDSVTEDPTIKMDWEVRKRAYVAAVATKSARAAFVTACDKLHNANAILNDHLIGEDDEGATVWDRFGDKSRGQVVAYYTAMVAALHSRIPEPLWERLARTVAALEMLADPVEHQRWVDRLGGRVEAHQ